LLNNDKSIYPAVGLVAFILFISSMIGYELHRLYRRDQLDQNRIIAIIIISALIVILMKITSFYSNQLNHLYLLVPIATGVLLLKLLLFERFSMMMAIIYSLIASIIFNG